MLISYKGSSELYSIEIMSTTRQIHSLFFDSLPSTNSWLKEHIDTLDPQGLTCVIAKQQTKGRGQQGKVWVSCPGNLLATFYFTTNVLGGNFAQLLSLSCVIALQKEDIFLSLKWPNDLILEEKKVGGILCETIPLDKHVGVIIGIGLNCASSPQHLDQPVTSLAETFSREFDTQKLCHMILTQFLQDLTLFEREGFAPFHNLYSHFLNKKCGDPICIQQGSKKMEGLFHSIDTNGSLVVQQQDGSLVTLFSGHLAS